jgi:hypothetical protein
MKKIYSFYSTILNGTFDQVTKRLEYIGDLTIENAKGQERFIVQDSEDLNKFFVLVEDYVNKGFC